MPILQVFTSSREFLKIRRYDIGATRPELEVQLLNQFGDNFIPISFKGGTAKFTLFRISDGSKKIDAVSATIDDTIVKYQWKNIDVTEVGEFLAQFEVTVGSGKYLIPDNHKQKIKVAFGE